jgi:hypothetical protein
MPRDVNQPPELNPRNLRAPMMEHFDNTSKDDKGNTVTNATDQDGNSVAGATTATGSNNTDSSKPTVTVSGDLTGTQQVFPGTVLGEALVKVTPDLSKYDFTGFDGKAVDINKKVEGDMSVTAKSKQAAQSSDSKTTPQQGAQQQAGA